MNQKGAAQRRYYEEINRKVDPQKYLILGAAIRRTKAKYQDDGVVYLINGYFHPGRKSKHVALMSKVAWPKRDD